MSRSVFVLPLPSDEFCKRLIGLAQFRIENFGRYDWLNLVDFATLAKETKRRGGEGAEEGIDLFVRRLMHEPHTRESPRGGKTIIARMGKKDKHRP